MNAIDASTISDSLIQRMLRVRDSAWVHSSPGAVIAETAADLDVPRDRVAALWERRGEVALDQPMAPVADSVIEYPLRRSREHWGDDVTHRALYELAFELGVRGARVEALFEALSAA